MKLSKLKAIHVIIIGIVLCVIAGGAMWYFPIRNNQAALKAQNAKLQDAITRGGTPQAVAQAEAAFHESVRKAEIARQELDVFMKAKMPDINLARRDTGMMKVWTEQCQVLGPLLTSWIKNSGVEMLSSISLPPPPTNPNDPKLNINDASFMVLDIGKVTVTGSFKKIMNHLRKWNDCSRLVLIDAPTLSGQSPYLVCEYSLKVYIAPTAPAGPEIPMAGQGTGDTNTMQNSSQMSLGGP